MRQLRPAVILMIALIAAGCSSYAPMSEEQMKRDRRGDLLIDIALRHDLSLSERYVATYTTGRRVGHLFTLARRDQNINLPLVKVDELYALAETHLLHAPSATGPTCYDCTRYMVVVRVGSKVHSFSGWLTDDATHVTKTMRAMGVR